MAASQAATFNLQEFTDAGQLLVGGRLYTYAYGTTAQKTAYTDPVGTVPHTYTADGAGGQYIALNARGELPAPLYLVDGSYDLSLKRADGSTVWTRKADGVENSVRALNSSLTGSLGATLIGFLQNGAGAVARWVMDKLRERVSIDDYPDLQTALDAISGVEKTGFGASAVLLDLLGREVTFTGTVFWPINVSFKNGTLTSTTGRLVLRNPFLANTALRGYTEYWPYMKAGARNVAFNCLTINNCYIGLNLDNCTFPGTNGALVHVNSNNLWTERTTFRRSFFASNPAVGAAILYDGNSTGTSPYSTGTGPGRADGSFGYTKLSLCTVDSTAPAVGIKIDNGAAPYNGKFEIDGYARGTGGAVIYVNNGSLTHFDIRAKLESFGAASNVISLGPSATFSFNGGMINSASPEMTMSQDPAATVVNNNIGVEGIPLQDKTGALVPFGNTVLSYIRNHLLKRLDYFSGSAYVIDTVTGATVTASTALESRVANTGQITSRPNDTRSSSSRNWAFRANNTAFGDFVLMESTANNNDPATVRMQVQSGGACFNTTGTWGVLSDARKKENVVNARDYLADLLKLRVVKYSLIEEHLDHPNLLGVIAQEVEQVFPALVSTNIDPDTGEETKQVKSSVLLFMLLKALQELAAEVEARA